jgi:hypothetical protein
MNDLIPNDKWVPFIELCTLLLAVVGLAWGIPKWLERRREKKELHQKLDGLPPAVAEALRRLVLRGVNLNDEGVAILSQSPTPIVERDYTMGWRVLPKFKETVEKWAEGDRSDRNQDAQWKQIVRKWWGPVVTYLLASVLNLSQKQSITAVIVLLSVCTLWTWLAIISLSWWAGAIGWKKELRALLPLPFLVLLLWGAIVFFKPQVPPISYPWVSTNTFILDENKQISEVQLHLWVREDPLTAESRKGIASILSLYNLNLSVSTPMLVLPNGGLYTCSVGQVSAAEWNNHNATQNPLAIVRLQRDTTVLQVSGSSRNATWQGIILMHKNGDWQESLGGWVDAGRGKQAVRVEESRKNNKTVYKLEQPIQFTPEQLVKYGVPFKEKFEPTVDTCPPPAS